MPQAAIPLQLPPARRAEGEARPDLHSGWIARISPSLPDELRFPPRASARAVRLYKMAARPKAAQARLPQIRTAREYIRTKAKAFPPPLRPDSPVGELKRD